MMSTKDVAALFLALVGIAMIVCSFGIASDFAGRDETQRQFDCISQPNHSYVAIKDDDDYIRGYQCVVGEPK